MVATEKVVLSAKSDGSDFILAEIVVGFEWRKRSRVGQLNGGRWDTFDEAKLMIFS